LDSAEASAATANAARMMAIPIDTSSSMSVNPRTLSGSRCSEEDLVIFKGFPLWIAALISILTE